MADSGKGSRTIAREYLRVSRDSSGRMRSVDEQHADHERLADELGWQLGTPYAEDSAVSASRYGRKARDGFASLVADLERDRFGASVLVLWEPSRGSRRLSEWARLLELLEDRGIGVHVTSHGRTYDLTNPRDRRSLHEDGTDAEYESGKASLRVKRAVAAGAAEGRPFGRAPYGYIRRYDARNRRLLTQEPEPTEAPVVRELFRRLVAGHSMRAIARDFENRGVRTRSGRSWIPEHLRKLAERPVYAGLRTHNGTLYEGQWEGLVDRAAWHQVQRLFADPARKASRPGGARHLLSMIAPCDICGGPLTVSRRNNGSSYYCRDGGHVRIAEEDLDDYAERAMLAYLRRPDVYEQLSASDADTSEQLQSLRDELGELRSRLDALADDLDIDEATLARRSKALKAKIVELEGRERELSTPSVLRGLITPGKDVRRRWKAAPMSTRREVARMLLSVDVLGELRIMRRPRDAGPRHVPVEDRVRWRRKP